MHQRSVRDVAEVLLPLSGLGSNDNKPTAHAVGYLYSPLRGWVGEIFGTRGSPESFRGQNSDASLLWGMSSELWFYLFLFIKRGLGVCFPAAFPLLKDQNDS